MRALCACVLLLLLGLRPCASKADEAPALSPTPPPVETWHYERWIGDSLRDSGDASVASDQYAAVTADCAAGGKLQLFLQGSAYDWRAHRKDPPLFEPITPRFTT